MNIINLRKVWRHNILHQFFKLLPEIDNFGVYIKNYIMDWVLCVWQVFFQKIAPDNLYTRSLVQNLCLYYQQNKKQEASLKLIVNILHRLTNGKYFKGVDLFLGPIWTKAQYLLYIINIARNKAYVIGGFSEDFLYEEDKSICKEFWL